MTTADTRPFFARLADDLRQLRGAPRELWLVYLVKFLESVAYFAIYNLLNVALTEDYGFGDEAAGTITGSWLTAVSVLMFFSGFVADSLGIRRALLTSVLSCLGGRVLMAVASTPSVALAGLAVSTWGVASMMPTMTAAVRRYTTPSTVPFGFSFFYVVMNVGAFVAPLTIGALRRGFPKKVLLSLPLVGPHFASSSQIMFAIAALATLCAVFCVVAMRPDAEVDGTLPRPAENPLRILREVTKEREFWGFMLLVSLLVLVKLIFQHAHQTWPKYAMREFGHDFDWAWFWAINPAMVMLLTPVATALTRHLSPFRSIVVGAVVTSLSVFAMAFSTSVPASVAFIVLLSMGEMVWSPRLYEYTATVAPPGREASYMGLSQLPMFLAKPAVGWTSGLMLATWCPEVGDRHSQLMWLVIGATTLAGPVLLVVLRHVIERRPAPQAAAAAAT